MSTYCLLPNTKKDINSLFMSEQIDLLFSLLERRGIKDADFARMIGESPQTLGNWKKRGKIPGDKVPKVTAALSKPTDWLMVLGEQLSQVSELQGDYKAQLDIYTKESTNFINRRLKSTIKQLNKAAEDGALTTYEIDLLQFALDQVEKRKRDLERIRNRVKKR